MDVFGKGIVYGCSNLQVTAPSQDLSGVGSDSGGAINRGYIIHGDDGEGRNRGWRWSQRQAHSASPPAIGFLPGAVVYNAQGSRAETPRLQRGQKLSRKLPHSARILLEDCEAGKAPRVVLISSKGRGREAVYTCIIL